MIILLYKKYKTTKTEKINLIENMVETDSTYSNCKVGCIIACSKKNRVLDKDCYFVCVDQCWNF